MAAGNRYLIGRGLWLQRSHLELSCALWPGSRRGHFRFARLLYGNRILLRLGRDTRSLGLLRRLDQLEIAVA
ncbi:hypothetical protein D3C79_1091260 [compost metagenome]